MRRQIDMERMRRRRCEYWERRVLPLSLSSDWMAIAS
uniref:Uncharacterized protein n=1 Tax=Aegilops tauschii subsp. strangulata TaxID=200361 RepID=A0A453MP25_AEGTS